jgi:hypothetical protein
MASKTVIAIVEYFSEDRYSQTCVIEYRRF